MYLLSLGDSSRFSLFCGHRSSSSGRALSFGDGSRLFLFFCGHRSSFLWRQNGRSTFRSWLQERWRAGGGDSNERGCGFKSAAHTKGRKCPAPKKEQKRPAHKKGTNKGSKNKDSRKKRSNHKSAAINHKRAAPAKAQHKRCSNHKTAAPTKSAAQTSAAPTKAQHPQKRSTLKSAVTACNTGLVLLEHTSM
jgi:hypothetical protein